MALFFVILGLTTFVELRLVTDGRTDGRTHDDSNYRASIASRGKKDGTDRQRDKQTLRRMDARPLHHAYRYTQPA